MDSPPFSPSELTGEDLDLDAGSSWYATDSEDMGDDADADDADDGGDAGDADNNGGGDADADFLSAVAAAGVNLPRGLPPRPPGGYASQPGLDPIEPQDSSDPGATTAVISAVR